MSFVSSIVNWVKHEPVSVIVGVVGTLVLVGGQVYTHQLNLLAALPLVLAAVARLFTNSSAFVAELRAKVQQAQAALKGVQPEIDAIDASDPALKAADDALNAALNEALVILDDVIPPA